MNFTPDPSDERFRADARAFIRETLADLFPNRARGVRWAFDPAATRTWTRALNRKGWSVPAWPAGFGGTGWPPRWTSILADEMVAANCPQLDAVGMAFVGPVICHFGSDWQKQRFLPGIRNGDEFWCQGFSEPDAGSDTMSLRTSAVPQGRHFVVNGRKLWTTNAHAADMMFALVRIDAPGNRRQQGLSCLLVDMRAPGVALRRVILIDGIHRVNEITFENVRVPVENLVGEQGKGWVYSRYLLDKERTIVAGLPVLRRQLRSLRDALSEPRPDGERLIDRPSERLRLAQYEVELEALEFLELRLLHAAEEDAATQVLASMLKLRGSELRQRVSETLWEVSCALEFSVSARSDGEDTAEPDLGNTHWSVVNYLFQRSATIVGGTSEIQRNIIAGVSLGL